MKYDKMVAVNKAESEKKIELAIQAIEDMSSKIGYISVAELVKQTGLSRGFFYKNKIVRERLDQVSENVDILVKGTYLREGDDIQGLRKKLKQLDGENNKLKLKIQDLQRQNEELQREMEKYHKRADKKEMDILKKL
mgnify:FL=1